MRVLKFGGTSVGTPDSIRQVGNIIQQYQEEGTPCVVVVSAMKGVTNQLHSLAINAIRPGSGWEDDLVILRAKHLSTLAELSPEDDHEIIDYIVERFDNLRSILQAVSLINELSGKTLDLILSFGERLSARIITHYLHKQGLQVNYLDAREVIVTDEHFGNARVDFTDTNRNIKEHFKAHPELAIVTGFVARSFNNHTTTLGRGGSDYTAAIIAGALDAERLEIWTDVDGVMTADPRKVKEAYSMPHLSYIEALEMSHFGAKVIYPPTLHPVISNKIPLWIKNTFNPEYPGSLIQEEPDANVFTVKGISSIEDIALLNLTGSGMVGVPGMASRLFGALAMKDINVILITQASSEHSITFAVKPNDALEAKRAIEDEFKIEMANQEIDEIEIERELSIVAVIGENMHETHGLAGKIFGALGRNGINVVAIAQGSSELNLSVVVNQLNLTKSLNALHEAFFLSDRKQLNIFLVGTGLIGGTLLEQINKQFASLLKEKHLKINVAGIANSRNMHFDEDGIDLSKWRSYIDYPGKNTDLNEFVEKMTAFNLLNSVFVDCTSSPEVIPFYHDILSSSISIITPNKIANSGSTGDYQKLRKAAFVQGVKFLYETNVGAGLPIINTMNDLLGSGDRIIKIEGILSGTISYIFNNFKQGATFSEVVKEAKAKGLTEPDPRDDLNGLDVARKILILSREAGHILELDDVSIDPILPETCFKAKTVEDFFKELEKEDPQLDSLRLKAENEGKVLRFIASFEEGKAQVKLEAVGQDHPFYSLSGSDNIISLTTERYHERPLVVKGPGAGAEVTSAGVFAEIISLSNYFTPEKLKTGGNDV